MALNPFKNITQAKELLWRNYIFSENFLHFKLQTKHKMLLQYVRGKYR